MQGNKEEISYQRSNKGKMKPSLGLVASPGTEGGAIGTPTFVSADVVDPTAGVFVCSPMMSGGAEPIGGIKEEEAIGKKKKKKMGMEIRNERRRRRREKSVRLEVQALFFFLSF